MGDIVLTVPLEVTPSAKIIRTYAWQITPEGITANLNYYTADGTQIVKQETFYITGADFAPLANAVVQTGHVGQKFMDIIEKSIRTKILAMKGLGGTVS